MSIDIYLLGMKTDKILNYLFIYKNNTIKKYYKPMTCYYKLTFFMKNNFSTQKCLVRTMVLFYIFAILLRV